MQTIHPLTKAREDHNLTQIQLAEAVKLSGKTIWSAEHNKPISAHSRRCLCRYFKKSSEELGLVSEEANIRDRQQANQLPPSPVPAQPPAPVDVEPPLVQPAAIPPTHLSVSIMPAASIQAIDLLTIANDVTLEEQAGAWLAVGTAHLGQLFDANWSVEDILQGLQVVLRGVQGMSPMTRRSLLRIGAGALLAEIAIPDGKHVSAGEQIQLCQGLGESIGTAWKLFFTVGNAQLLAIGQAQLAILQQAHSFLPPLARSSLFTGVYNLIGIALHFQQRYDESLQSHRSAYIAALSTGDPWHVVQCLLSQANDYQALDRYTDAIQSLEESLRIIGDSDNESLLRSKAHLFGCWADVAMAMEDFSLAKEKLDESAAYLDRFSPNEEFDRASWLHLSGKCALMAGDNTASIQYLEQGLAAIPSTWLLRRIITAVPLSVAYALAGQRESSLITAEQVLPLLNAINSPMLNQFFINCVEYSLLDLLPRDSPVLNFVAKVRTQTC